MNTVVVVSSGVRRIKTAALVETTIQRSLAALKKNGFVVEVSMIKDAEMKRLNLHFRKKNKATNILSFLASSTFPRPDIQRPFRYLGEIYLAPQYITQHHEDIRRLAIHGLLHLLGYTHKVKRDRIRMEALEERLQSKLFKK